LPRSTKSRAVQGEQDSGVAVLEREGDVENVTTAEDVDEELSDPRFSFTSEAAPEDFQPDRKTPGRVRQPSYFDDVLRRDDVFDTGNWQRIPVDGPEHAEAALRELNRSKLHLNKQGLAEGLPEIGLDLDVRLKDKGYDEDAVYYRSRTAQKRERKPNGQPTDSAENEGEFDDEYDDENE
jgi:phage protein D